VEPLARNTGENIKYSRNLLMESGVDVASVLLVSKPYEERRVYATARKLWPEVQFVSTSTPMPMEDYVASIGNPRLVVDMLVGSLQRLLIYPRQGFLISMPVPQEVTAAYERLREAGFTSRLASDPSSRTFDS